MNSISPSKNIIYSAIKGVKCKKIGGYMVRTMVFNAIVAVSFISGGNRSTRRKSLTCLKSDIGPKCAGTRYPREELIHVRRKAGSK